MRTQEPFTGYDPSEQMVLFTVGMVVVRVQPVTGDGTLPSEQRTIGVTGTTGVTGHAANVQLGPVRPTEDPSGQIFASCVQAGIVGVTGTTGVIGVTGVTGVTGYVG